MENDTQYYAKIVTKATVDNTTLTSESTDKSCYSCLSPVSGVAYDHSYDPDGDDSDVFIDPDVSDDTRDYSKVHDNAPSLKLKWTNSNKAQDSGIQVMENDSTVLQTFEGSDLEECIVTEVIGNTFYKLGVRRYKVVNGTTLYSPITYCAAAKLTKPAPVAFTVTEIENDAEGGLFNQIEFSWVNPNPNLPGVGGYHTEKLYCFSFDGNRNWKKCFEVDFNEEENIEKYSQGSYSVDKAIGITTENRFYLSFVANQAATDRWSDTLYKPSIKVRNLTVTKTSNGTTTIKWLNPSDISNYTIQCWKKVGNGDYELYKSFTSDQTTDSDSISDQIETYYYQFKILDRFGNPFSNGETVTAKLPVMQPVQITSASVGHNKITVTWDLPKRVGEHTGFRVEAKIIGDFKRYSANVGEDATHAIISASCDNRSKLESVYVYTVYNNDGALGMVPSANGAQ